MLRESTVKEQRVQPLNRRTNGKRSHKHWEKVNKYLIVEIRELLQNQINI
jgi:hypothetical protein